MAELLQVLANEKQKADHANYARVIADAGIRAAQDPIKFFVPIVVGFLALRTVTQGLQIFVEDEIFRSYHVAFSEFLHMLLKLRAVMSCLSAMPLGLTPGYHLPRLCFSLSSESTDKDWFVRRQNDGLSSYGQPQDILVDYAADCLDQI